MKNKSDFTIFKEEFTEYQKLWGLTDYKVVFLHEPIDDDCFADIHIMLDDMVATVTLNSLIGKETNPLRNIPMIAKHEALRLLLGSIESIARSRYTTPNEIYKAVEGIVNRLQTLIPDIKPTEK